MIEALASPPSRQPGPWTWEDFIALDEDDARELIDGQLVEIDMPTYPHERIVALTIGLLVAWALPRRAGEVLASGYKIRVSQKRGIMPDVQFYRTDNPARPGRQGLEKGRPDLVVEVVSPSSRSYDLVKKLNWYADLGVPEYWIIDPDERTLQRLLLRDGQYVIASALEGDTLFQPDTFPDLAISLDTLWGTEPAAGE